MSGKDDDRWAPALHEEGERDGAKLVGCRWASSLAGDDAWLYRGRPPRNKGRRYPADPPTVDEIIAVMRAAGAGKGAARLRALIVLLWRAGLVDKIEKIVGEAGCDLLVHTIAARVGMRRPGARP